MKNFILVLFGLCFCYNTVAAKRPPVSYQEEMYLLGAVSGQGLACKSKQYHKFELLARAMIVTKATSDEEQKQGMESYATGKIDSFADVENQKFRNCDGIRQVFESQKIFNNVLYSDGRIKMYDGKILTPRKPYDAGNLYQKDPEAFIKADAAYKKYREIAEKSKQSKHKIELKDSNVGRYSNLFN